MLIYRVTINNTYRGLTFDFVNWDEATIFMSLVLDYGKYGSAGDDESVKVTVEEVAI